LSVAEDDFFDLSPPSFLQQGDLLQNVPLLGLPPSKALVVLRTPGTRGPWDLQAGLVEAVHELGVTSFADGSPEYIVASAQRGLAMLVTQTCNLEDNDHWSVCPAYEVKGSKVDRKTLFDGKYPNLFGIFRHPEDYFPESYVDLGDIRPIRNVSTDRSDRVASLSQEAQYELSEKIAAALGREWGFREGESVPQSGRYRRRNCAKYAIAPTECDFVAGNKFTRCEKCKEIHKTEQWYLLLKHKRS
jgi:hypothetical protein